MLLHLFSLCHFLELLIFFFFFYHVYSLFFPKCHIIGIIERVTISEWLLSLISMHFSFIHVFSWLDNSLLLLNNTVLYGCGTVYLLFCWRTSWLLLVLGDYEYSCYKDSYAGFCVDTFSNQLGKYLEVCLLDHMVRPCLAL